MISQRTEGKGSSVFFLIFQAISIKYSEIGNNMCLKMHAVLFYPLLEEAIASWCLFYT